jgi:Methylase involved in ubiquinone/menaquinone biosynthesis
MPQTTTKPDYGNWVSKRIIYLPLLLGLAILPTAILLWETAIVSALLFVVAGYFAYARRLFSPNGANVQSQIWDNAVSKLQWNGQGRALDIGCGNGALTIKVAKKYPIAKVTGIDYWGTAWEFSKTACEANAKAEGVAERVEFQKASASKLPFEDGYFDAAVSNLCFHEVADTKDKHEVLREAFRVLKVGGKFAFQDLFLLKQIYGEPEELVATIKSWGIKEVEFIETRNEPFIPGALKLPFMVGRLAIIKGEK